MELVKAAVLFFVGVAAAAVFFVSGWDHSLPHWLRVSRYREPIHLTIASGAASESPDCPATYAVDNRTDRAVVLTVADASPGYASLPPASDWPADYGDDHPYRHHTAFVTSDTHGPSGPPYPGSSEPSVSPPDDSDPGFSNYGSSSPDYSTGEYGRSDSGDQYSAPGDYAYDERDGYGDQQSAPYAQDGSGEDFGGSPASQPIPLTPQYDSQDQSQLPPAQSYGPPSSAVIGPSPTRVKPGEVFFASSGNASPRCNGNAGTVTLQLSE